MTRSSDRFGRRMGYGPVSSSVLALLVAACGESSESEPAPVITGATTTTATDRTSDVGAPMEAVTDGDLDIIVPPGADGSLPAELWVGCKPGPRFQMSDLDAIVLLGAGDPGGVAEAIEVFLSGDEGQYWPQEGWQILRQTDDEVLLVHPGTDGLSFMNVSRVDGSWTWAGSQSGGPCPLQYVVPEGLNTVEWRIDPEAPPNASATTLTVLISEEECVSGQEIGARLRGPQIVMTDDVVRIAFAARPPPGDAFTCPSNPETRLTVELPAPLGDREIIEGLAIGIDLEDYLDQR